MAGGLAVLDSLSWVQDRIAAVKRARGKGAQKTNKVKIEAKKVFHFKCDVVDLWLWK